MPLRCSTGAAAPGRSSLWAVPRALLTVLACLALAGCGTREPSDEEQIRATLSALADATRDKDYGRLCDEVFARDLLDGIARIGLPCELAMRQAYEDVEDPRLTIGEVAIDGETATAQVRSSAKGQQPSRDVVTLVEGEQGWRVSSLGEDSTVGSEPAP